MTTQGCPYSAVGNATTMTDLPLVLPAAISCRASGASSNSSRRPTAGTTSRHSMTSPQRTNSDERTLTPSAWYALAAGVLAWFDRVLPLREAVDADADSRRDARRPVATHLVSTDDVRTRCAWFGSELAGSTWAIADCEAEEVLIDAGRCALRHS